MGLLFKHNPAQKGRPPARPAPKGGDSSPSDDGSPFEGPSGGQFKGMGAAPMGGGRSPYGVLASQDAASTQSHVSLYSTRSEASLLPKTSGGGAWNGAKRKEGYSAGGGGFLYDPKHDPEVDDYLHNPSPHDRFTEHHGCNVFSARGWLNVGALVLLAGGLVALFAGYPMISYFSTHDWSLNFGWNIGGVNASGQVPNIPNLKALIDGTTPTNAFSRTGFDGQKYNLVFSDEFSQDGRTFWPGDDPYWEAVDLHYWATNDYEWYDPDAVTTADGNLVISITEEAIHNLDFRSGMIQSWNKFCFTGGYIEVSISLPGSNDVPGFWPGAWTMGNLARAGYGATTDGLWPYSYDSCDVGTFRNQTDVDGQGPAAALTSGNGQNGALSYLPGQRLSACTCAGSDHPGPFTNVGRGAPEIDILEAQVSGRRGNMRGGVSQSAQFAPFDAGYNWSNASATIYNTSNTHFNSYKGGVFQEAASGVSYTDPTIYNSNGANYQKFGFEYYTGADGKITWSVGDEASWSMDAAAVGPNAAAGIGQRLISEEPMYIILNLAISSSFQDIDFANLQLPNRLLVDYVRVYQREGHENIGCDPKGYPTSQYIENHPEAYSNPNYTTWQQAGYTYPRNQLQDGC